MIFSVIFNNTDISSGLTITELMYNDPGPYDNLDYIELYNNSTNNIPLGGLSISDAISFVFPEYDLAPGQYAILAKSAWSGSSPCNTYPAGCGFETFFGFAPTFEWSTGYHQPGFYCPLKHKTHEYFHRPSLVDLLYHRKKQFLYRI